jgi:hypothetical protein
VDWKENDQTPVRGTPQALAVSMILKLALGIIGSMLPALDLENRDDALVTSSYATQVPAPRAGVLVDVVRPLGLQR